MARDLLGFCGLFGSIAYHSLYVLIVLYIYLYLNVLILFKSGALYFFQIPVTNKVHYFDTRPPLANVVGSF